MGRIGAQTAKQVIIQKIREAERDALYDEYFELSGQMVGGVVQRNEGRATTVSLGNVEAILPRGEQIPGETHHVNERVRATVFEVRKSGSRVKVILSRARPQLVQRLLVSLRNQTRIWNLKSLDVNAPTGQMSTVFSE